MKTLLNTCPLKNVNVMDNEKKCWLVMKNCADDANGVLSFGEMVTTLKIKIFKLYNGLQKRSWITTNSSSKLEYWKVILINNSLSPFARDINQCIWNNLEQPESSKLQIEGNYIWMGSCKWNKWKWKFNTFSKTKWKTWGKILCMEGRYR